MIMCMGNENREGEECENAFYATLLFVYLYAILNYSSIWYLIYVDQIQEMGEEQREDSENG